MATNAGEVKITLKVQDTAFKKSIQEALSIVKTLKVEARQLNAVLSQRIAFPLTAQLKGVDRLLRQANTSAVMLGRSFPRSIPSSFSASIKSARVNAQALNASLKTSARTATAVGTQGKVAFDKAGRSAKTMTRNVNKGSQSLTLLVAKFALITFAAQTLANIFDKTFGAALRNVDDFEQGVISTAAAITNLADLQSQPGATFGQAFAQNLGFVRGAFAELEVIAGNFFSTAQDLQLGFNTLAARGVVIRREEFNTLGLITDQIKLQTRGQSSSIQIAQEIRNLFTGQVRAADQLAQLIKAQGGDVKEISDELRRTGSLKPLEPFVAGLREAQGLIRGLLTPAVARFQALVSQIGRFAFADVFEDTVGFINEINDFLAENRGLLVEIANLVINRVARAFKGLAVLANVVGNIIFDIASSQVPLLGLGVGLLARRFGVIPAILTSILGGLIQNEGGATALGEAFKLLGNIIELSVLSGLFQINAVLEFLSNPLIKIRRLFLEIDAQILSGVRAITRFQESIGLISAEKAEASISKINNQLFDIAKMEFDIDAELAKDGDGKTLTERLEEANKELEELIKNGREATRVQTSPSDFLGSTEAEIEKARAARAKAEQQLKIDPFATNIVGGDDDDGDKERDFTKRILEAQRRLRAAEARRVLAITSNLLKDQENLLNDKVAREIITEREAFEERQALRAREADLELGTIDTQIAGERRSEEEQRIRITKSQGTFNEQLAEQQLNSLQTAIRIKTLEERRIGVQQRLTDAIAEENAQLEQTRIKTERILEAQQREMNTFFVETVANSLDALIAVQEKKLRELESRAGVTPEQIKSQETLNQSERIATAIEGPVNAVLEGIDDAFKTIIDGFIQGGIDFKTAAADIGRNLLDAGLEDLLNNLKQTLSDGLQSVFTKLGEAAAGQAAAALAAGIGLLLTVLSRSGSEGSFTPGGAGGGGSVVESSQAVRGIIGGDTSIAIAQINSGLQEALIPTNNILSTIERNTRSLAELNLNIDPDQLSASIQNTLADILNTALLQVSP